MASSEVQRVRAINFMKDKITQKFDKLVTTWQGYDKMRSRMLPRSLSTMMVTGEDDEEGPFSSRKRAERAIAADHDEEDEICNIIRNRGRSVRKLSCPAAEFDVLNAFHENPNEFLSLPPIPIYMHETTSDTIRCESPELNYNDPWKFSDNCDQGDPWTPKINIEPNNADQRLSTHQDQDQVDDNSDQKLVFKPRRHSLFAFSPTDTLTVVDYKAQSAPPRRSLTVEEEPLLSIARSQRVQVLSGAGGRRGSTKRKSKKKKIVSTETGAIMPAVLLTYQGGLFLGECESQLQNSTHDYRVSVC